MVQPGPINLDSDRIWIMLDIAGQNVFLNPTVAIAIVQALLGIPQVNTPNSWLDEPSRLGFVDTLEETIVLLGDAPDVGALLEALDDIRLAQSLWIEELFRRWQRSCMRDTTPAP